MDNQVNDCLHTGKKVLTGPDRIDYCLLSKHSCPYQSPSDKALYYCRIARYGGTITP
ncbi:hypothetical protein HOD38_02050 [archaeon]|nr:hypothetical protein [archaeon]MBT4397026.1 hypothetical protein [archaeon]MBT4441017.1 hypothetical protein [archaeon]